MNKKVSVGITAAFLFIAVAITFTATMIFAMNLFDKKIVSVQERASMYDKISEIDSAVRQNYYAEIDDDAVLSALAKGYLDGIDDPYTRYVTAHEIAVINANKRGETVGLGISAEKNASGYAVVTSVVADSVADKVGIKAGDVILRVNGEDALALGFDAVDERLTGIEGEKVTLIYSRGGEESIVELIYTTIETTSVRYYTAGDYFYIRFTDLNALTASQFDYAMNTAAGIDNIKGYVFDVRDLSGGYDLSVVAGILDELMPQGTLVSGVYAGGVTKVLYTSDAGALAKPAVVLVNGQTKGFGELFAAVLGESALVRIVGSSTAGKGTYQELVQLTDGSGVYVSVCKLLACGTVEYDGTGVTPDFIVSAEEGFVLTEEQPSGVSDLQYRKALEVLGAEFAA